MKIHYLEIVATNVDAVCTTYESAHKVKFGDRDGRLGNARTAELADGGMVGVREPLRDDEAPIVRPYWLVNNIEEAVEKIEASGGTIALPPMEISGLGSFAIYQHEGNDHGLWQL